MAIETHEAMCTESDQHRALFECPEPGCGFRAAIIRADGRYTLLECGADPAVRHSGGTTPGVILAVDR